VSGPATPGAGGATGPARRPGPAGADRRGGVRASERGPGGAIFWIAAVLGLGIVGFGLAGLLRNVPVGPQRTSWGAFLIGSLAAHDALLAPVVAVLSLVLVRFLPARIRPPLQAGLAISAVVALIAIPLLGGWGRRPHDPTLLPDGDYWGNLLIVLAVVWGVAVAVAIAGLLRRR